MRKKRVLAYIIDIAIVVGFLSVVFSFLPTNIDKIHLVDLNQKYINDEIEFNQYFEQYTVLNHNIAKDTFGFNIFSLIVTIFYFIIIPYLNNGATLGKKIFKIKVKRNDRKKLEIADLASRSVLIDGVGYLMFLLIFVYILPSNAYFWIENILGFAQIMVVIISGFMVLYKKNELGLHDILTKTKVGLVK